jgi:hypothetical protein
VVAAKSLSKSSAVLLSEMSDTSNLVRALLGPRAQQVGILEDTELLITSTTESAQ